MENRKKAIKNFFQGRYSRKDYFSIQNEFEKEDADKDFLFELEQQWKTIKERAVDGFRKEAIWHRVAIQLDFTTQGNDRSIHIWGLLQRIAAVLFIPVVITFLIYFYSNNSARKETAWAEIICPSGVRTEFQLPDGSTGVLNSESSLKYAVNFTSNRIVQLQGQAYFDVVKDKSHPFDVVTKEIRVEVLGTTFSVSAYPNQINEEVVLKTGKVKVSTVDKKPLATLSPDQLFVLKKDDRKYYTENVNAEVLISWIDGKLVFKGERLEDVAERLSRWYQVDIEIKEQKLKDYGYYGTFENEPLDEVLRLIAITAPIKYQEIKRTKLADGTFSNRKIILITDEMRKNDFN